MNDRKRRPRGLLTGWAVVSLIYVAVAGDLSVAPIRSALARAQRLRHLPPPPPPKPTNGPLPARPDTPTELIAKAAVRQTTIAFAPPLLVLWFGWDVWFALLGFLSPRREDGGAEIDEESSPL